MFLPVPLDGEAAVAVARGFLTRMGVDDLDGLAGLGLSPVDAWRKGEKSWGVGFATKDGGGFSVQMTLGGKVFYAARTARRSAGRPVDDATARRYAQRLMARVPNAVPVRMGEVGRGAAPGASVQFYALVGGRRYWNLNPTYGYYFSFDEKGKLTWFGREDAPPPPVGTRPRMARGIAVAKLTQAWKTSDHAAGWPYPRFVEAELGYYHRKGEPRSRLVWHGEVFSSSQGSRRPFSTLDTLVDAATGVTFKADDRL